MKYDETGAVGVQLDARYRIERLAIAADWRDRLSPEELGQAIVALPATAMAENLTAVLKEHNDSREAETPPQDAVRVNSAPPRVSHEVAAEGRELWDQLLSRINDPSFGAEPQQPVEVTDPQHHVTVELSGDAVTRVTLEPRWAARAAVSEIHDYILRGLEEAYAAVDEGRTTRSAPLGDLQARIQDLQATMEDYQ